ncbi:hypothetical protein CANCADRAFT_2530 [Tortispora caseinolytica NRRL Y-17796]|uniref:Uncharacterized protein n=1 Tax=Tortispora caseinolytica NRRL Y-17796 TaxID=767744 RepID=A0A1E4TGA8_9ASCO|nr:hypothetical protein CANCADRAFT_2530 [Tortispora caseinolytica NRRL Y-17796]
MTPRAVITFDLFGTLVIPRLSIRELYSQISGVKLNSDFDDRFREHFKELERLYPNTGKDSIGYDRWWGTLVRETVGVDEKTANKMIAFFETEDAWKPVAHAREMIRNLSKIGDVGIISNMDSRAHALLQNLQLGPFSAGVFLSYETGFMKPDTRAFEGVKEKNGPHLRYFHVGDDYDKDIAPAIKLGWTAIYINENAHDVRPINYYEVKGLDEVEQKITSLLNQ